MTPRVALVGGDVAGAAVAYAFLSAPIDVMIFERAGRVGGRTATRRRGETVYDYGANYVTDDDERVVELLAGEFSEGRRYRRAGLDVRRRGPDQSGARKRP